MWQYLPAVVIDVVGIVKQENNLTMWIIWCQFSKFIWSYLHTIVFLAGNNDVKFVQKLKTNDNQVNLLTN